MKRKFRVVLPVELGGVVYEFGRVVELELEETAGYEHALIAVEEESDGGDSEGR